MTVENRPQQSLGTLDQPPAAKDWVVVSYQGRRLAFRRPAAVKAPLPAVPQNPIDSSIRITPGTTASRSRTPWSIPFLCLYGTRAWLVSAGAHVVVLAVLGLISVTLAWKHTDVLLLGETTTRDVLELAAVEISSPAPPERIAGAMAPRSVAIETELPAVEPVPGAHPAEAAEALARDASGSSYLGPVAEVRGLFGSGALAMHESSAEPSGVTFFGVQASGNRFVFVVDSSRSMTGRKWSLACRELVAALQRLRSDQFFYVIFFDGQCHPMFSETSPEGKLLPATPANITRLRRWMRTIEFGADTKPLQSMMYAMHLSADALFLLSDGEFQDGTVEFLRETNPRHTDRSDSRRDVIVHTIGLRGRDGQAVLQQIASENGGTYHFVP